MKNQIINGFISAMIFSEFIDINHPDNSGLSANASSFVGAYVFGFVLDCETLINQFCDQEGMSFDRVGQIFYYACAGHGVGFFDYDGDAAKALEQYMSDNWRRYYINQVWVCDDTGLVDIE